MPRIINYEEYEDEDLSFSKIRCPKGHKGKMSDQAIGIPRQSEYRAFTHPSRSLEDFSFLTDDLKTIGLEDRFIGGFQELYLDFSFEDMMQEYTSNFNDLPGENYWIDTSFIIKPGMVSGYHPDFGSVKLCELSFMHAVNNGLPEVNETYKELAKEVRKTNNQSTKELKIAIRKPCVYLPQQIVSEITHRKDLFQEKLKRHKEKNNHGYSKIIERRHKRARMIQGAIESKFDSIGSSQLGDRDLENRIYQHCHNVSIRGETGTSIADNHLVSHAMTKAIETNEPQIILTRDKGIYFLTRDISRVGRTLTRSKDYVPKFHLNNTFLKPTRLHVLELIPEF